MYGTLMLANCRRLAFLFVISLLVLNQSPVSAFQIIDPEKWDQPDPPQAPQLAPASDEASRAASSFRVPPGWKVELFAAEPMVANGVALHVDFDGTVLVCESFRQEKGVEDNRGHGHWLLDDLAAQTIENRRDYILKHLGDDAIKYTHHDDRIRLLRDTRGDGVADVSEVFADGFNTLLSGTGAGVLRYRGRTYFTCIPDLWLLTSSDNPDVADSREVLHRGYGVRFAFRGHDLHGLVIGPDGRLYYSIGDRGYNISTESGHWKDPASGAVFRCNLDGSDLQVIATGLRNPQGLAFDDYGNLFTGDNNSDSGDQSKWFYIVPGGDYGWRMNYQYQPDRGPYNRERLWNPYDPVTTAAYVIPPIANVADGPSGLVHYPGTGLGDEWLGSFFLCDFRGQTSSSGVRRLRNQPQGAFFSLADSDQPIWQILATDAKFSADGQLYILDWVEGWVGEGKGRIYRVFNPEQQNSTATRQTAKLLRGKLWEASSDDLQVWLAHPDQRVRQEAQFELVRRNEIERLLFAANQGMPAETDRLQQLARVHGIWGSYQWYRETASEDRTKHLPAFLEHFSAWCRDVDPAIRAIAAEQAGELVELKGSIDWQPLIDLVSDPDDRVSFMAMMAVGKLQLTAAGEAVLARINQNSDADPILRHGGIMALAGLDEPSLWVNAMKHSSPAVRRATSVALRRVANPALSDMLADGQVTVAVEAARAIYDLPLESEWEKLAAFLPYATSDDAIARRALNVNFHLGGSEHAQRLAVFAASAGGLLERRVEALQRLLEWDQSVPLDPVLNEYRPRAAGQRSDAVEALRIHLPQLLSSDSAIAVKTSEVAAALGIEEVAPILQAYFQDRQKPGLDRAAALQSWFRLAGKGIIAELKGAIADPAVEVRAAAIGLLASVEPTFVIDTIRSVLGQGEIMEQQAALRAIGALPAEATGRLLDFALERVEQRQLSAGASLELIEVMEKLRPDMLDKVLDSRRHDASAKAEDRYPELLVGGDATRGKRVFFEKTEVSCVRCHAVDGVGGGVGPDLSSIGILKNRGYLLEAVIDPNAVIAEGFETQLILDLDGVTHFGIVKSETEQFVELMDAEGQLSRIIQDDIEERRRGQSSMPAGLDEKLTPAEIRDLVEFLTSLRSERP